ncbi:MAG: hypothetical protein ACUVQ0_01235 [Thermoproteota archaeon]
MEEDWRMVLALLLGLLFIFSSILFGFAASTLLKIKLTIEERICISIPTGCASSTILVYLLSYLQGRLDFLSIGIGVLLMFLLSTVILFWVRRDAGGGEVDRSLNIENIAVILIGLIVFLPLNLWCIIREEAGSIYGSGFVIGDYCFHISVINSFVYRDNFPPEYPIITNTQMKYPFLVDFLSSILMKTGSDLRSSIIIPNLLFQVSILCLISTLALRIFGKIYIGVISALLFIFAGNMGVIYAISDAARSGDFTRWLVNLPTDYSGSGISDLPIIRFGNPVIVMLMPQRPSTLGISISLIIYILALYSIQRDDAWRESFFVGFLNGLLPSIHTHSFLAASAVLLFLAIIFRRGLKFLLYFFIPMAVLALPQVLNIRTQVGSGFMGSTIGWLKENSDKIMSLDWSTPVGFFVSFFQSIFLLASFWLMNLGFILILSIIGYLRSGESARMFYIPYLLLFLLGNFIRLQPWDWDNYKVFIHWHIITVILAAYGVLEVVEFSKYFKAGRTVLAHREGLATALVLVCLPVMLFLSMASGFLSHVKIYQENYLMWPRAEVAFASWIRENTPGRSIFLTSTYFLNPVPTLAGRQIIMGYEGWLWSHGIDPSRIEKIRRDIVEMFKGNYTLIREYNVSFIVVTDAEKRFASDNGFEINMEFFEYSGRFKKVYDETLNGRRYIVFKVC